MMRLSLPEGVYNLGFTGTFDGSRSGDVMTAVDDITQNDGSCETLCKLIIKKANGPESISYNIFFRV